MIKFFEYCFYRISAFYDKKVYSPPFAYSITWVSFPQTCNIITVINLFCFIVKLKYDFHLIILLACYFIVIITTFVINGFLLTEKKYKELIKRYKNEKHKKIKGWGVFLYVICSMFLFVYTFYKCWGQQITP